MNDTTFWRSIAYGYFICVNLCLLILVEMIFLGFPYLTLFLLIFALMLRVNLRLFKK